MMDFEGKGLAPLAMANVHSPLMPILKCFAGLVFITFAGSSQHPTVQYLSERPNCMPNIVGTLVDGRTGSPAPFKMAAVLLERLNSPTGQGHEASYTPRLETQPDEMGRFHFCESIDAPYAIVATASDAHGLVYPPTIITGVVGVTNLGKVELGAAGRGPSKPARLSGIVTTIPTPARVAVALQSTATDPAGITFRYQLPITPETGWHLPQYTHADESCPAQTYCATYSFPVPSAAPRVKRLDETSLVESSNAPIYTLVGTAWVANSTEPNCTPSSSSTMLQESELLLCATPGADLRVQTLIFTGCRRGTL